jgi:hypothetical protein
MKLVELKVLLVVGDDEYPIKWLADAIQDNLEEDEYIVGVDLVSEEDDYEQVEDEDEDEVDN